MTTDRERIEAALALLDADRSTDTCQCERCQKAIADAAGDPPCSHCGYNGPWVTTACTCASGPCSGGPYGRRKGCMHGMTFCPACDGAFFEEWPAVIKSLRNILTGSLDHA
jgi:hypothetical protein